MIKRLLFAIIMLISIAGYSSAQPASIASGVNWLVSNQNEDRSWGGNLSSASTFNTTAAAIYALRICSNDGPFAFDGLNWLNGQTADSVNFVANRLLSSSVAGFDTSSDLNQLIAWKNNIDGSWGLDGEYSNDVSEIALTLQSLHTTNYSDYSTLFQSINFLTSNQNADGGWAFVSGGPSNAYVTAITLRALAAFNSTFNVQGSIDKAKAYLLTKQNPDGGFGSSPSNAYETALSFISLIESGQAPTQPLQNAINYLTTTQIADGSWNDDPYSTALALQALAKVKPNLTASSISFSKTMPQSGESVTITAAVGNSGLENASNIVVRFYSGDPASGGVEIGPDQVIPNIAAGSSSLAAVTYDFTDTGSRTIFVVADPDNQIVETSETDNKASARLWVATSPDLTVFSDDLKPATYVPVAGTAFALEYTVRNLGETAADAFSVSLYDGDPSQGGTLLQTANISGIAGGGISTGTLGVTLTTEGAHTLYLAADSSSQITETSETNNSGSVTVQVGGTQSGADLEITPADITLMPSRPAENETVRIAARVRNVGTDTAFGFVVEIFDGSPDAGGTLLHSETPSLAPGVEQTITKDWTIPAGIHEIHVVADRQNNIVESNESNNRASVAVMTDMVDISLSANDLAFTPSRPVMGDTVALAITVRNLGISNTGAFNLGLYNGDPASGGVLLQTFPISGIAGDGSQSVVYTFTAQPQTYRFYAVADTENIVTELYESNNQAVRSLTIKGPGETYGPDLVPVKIDLSGTTTDSQTLAISGNALVTFQNKGDAKIASSFDVLVFEDRDMDGRYTQGVDKLLGSGTNAMTLWPEGANMISVPLSGTVKFLHSPLFAYIDSGDAILEQDETNNLLISCKDCEVRPANPIQPVLKWKWRDPQPDCHNWTVILQPVAITPLTDTNGDGRVDEKDDPFIIYVTNEAGSCWGGAGKIKAVNARTGQEAFTIHADPPRGMNSCEFVAAGDINNDHVPEIIIVNYSPVTDIGGVDSVSAYTYNGNGVTLLWNNRDKVYAYNKANRGRYQAFAGYGCTQPAIADIDGDGNPEIIVGPTVINGDGSIKWGYPIFYYWTGQGWPGGGAGMGYPKAIAADLDLDGKQEILAGNTAYNADGTIKWWNKSLPDGRSVVANFDDDPYPEVLYGTGVGGWAAGGIRIYLLDHNGSIIWGPVYLDAFESNASTFTGNEFVIADFDGDGEIEFGLRGYNKYFIFDKNGQLKSPLSMPWLTTGGVWERSSPTVFDLNGDGRPEVISNTTAFRIYDGRDGAILYEEGFAGGLYDQSVIVSDVDRDGHADIVAFGNYGINVYSAENNDWVAARTIWNQAGYHVTNVNDDGSIPQHEAPSWLLNNTYHTQAAVAPAANPYRAPNLTASYFRSSQSSSGVELTVRIGNGGAKEAQAGAVVMFYDGDPTADVVIGTAATTKSLNSGEYQDVILSVSGLSEGLHHVYAVVDAGNTISECREDDNQINTDVTVVTGLPDLKVVVEDVVLPNMPITEGNIVPVIMNVQNSGAVSASNVTVRLYNGNPATGGVQIGLTQTISAISSGGAAPINFTFDTLGHAGTNMLYVVLDQENSVIESSETNNVVLFTLDVQLPTLPNLTITADSIQITPASAQEGSQVAVTATIINRGSAVGNIPVRFYLGNPAAGGSLIAEQTIYPVLALGQTATVTATFVTTGLSGEQNISIAVDPANTIAESRQVCASAMPSTCGAI